MAKASPITSAAVVLDVGAKPKGQASFSMLALMLASERVASVEAGFPVIDSKGTPNRLIMGRMLMISPVSPEFERAKATSFSLIIPRSP